MQETHNTLKSIYENNGYRIHFSAALPIKDNETPNAKGIWVLQLHIKTRTNHPHHNQNPPQNNANRNKTNLKFRTQYKY